MSEILKQGWKFVRFGNLCDEIYRYPSYYGIQYVDDGVPELRPELIKNNGTVDVRSKTWRFITEETAARFSRTTLLEGDLIMSVRGTIGKVAIIPPKLEGANMTANLLRISPNRETVYPAYLWWFMRSPKFQATLEHISPSTTIKTIRVPDLRNILVPLPPLPEQRRIAAILDKADELRAKRRAALARLDDLLQSVFLEMFGDPVTNPKGWKEGTLGHVIYRATDGPHVSPNYTEKGVPFLSTRHIRPGRIIWQDLKYISPEDAKVHWEKCKPEYGDILYTKGGSTGLAKAIDFNQEIAVWVHIALLKTNHRLVDPLWLESMLNTPYCYSQSQRFTRGIANRDLGLTRMVNIKLYIPPLNLQQEFVEYANKIRVIGSAFESHLNTMDNLFHSLQQRAFWGELSGDLVTEMETRVATEPQQLQLFD